MAESRDRLIRTVDIAEVFARRRSGSLGIYSDEAWELFGSSVRQPVRHSAVGVPVGTSTMSGGWLRLEPRSQNLRGSNRSTTLRGENTPTMTLTAVDETFHHRQTLSRKEPPSFQKVGSGDGWTGTNDPGLIPIHDEARELFGSSLRQPVTHSAVGVPAGTSTMSGGGLRLEPRSQSLRGSNRSTALRGENTPMMTHTAMGRGRGRGTMLPSWYQRTPLGDITRISTATERRRANLVEGEGLVNESPISEDETIVGDSNVSAAQLEHFLSTLASTVRFKVIPSSPASTVGLDPSPPLMLKVSNSAICHY
ncbi:hypothetical protein PTKIN_Ptkin15bG0109500 [Pterospermum kingtungense]